MKLFRFFIMCALLFLCLCPSGEAARDENAGRQELERIKREMRQKQIELKKAGRKERSILTDLEMLDREVNAGKSELNQQQKQLRLAEASLQELEQSNRALNEELARAKEVYARRIRVLYKMSRNGYAASVLFPDNGEDPVKRIKYLGMIAERDHFIIERYSETLTMLNVKQAELFDRKNVLLKRRMQVANKKNELEGRKRQKGALLTSVRQQKELSEQALRELEESSSTLWAMIKRSEKERSKPSIHRAPPQSPAGTASGRNSMPWPLNGEVLTRFGKQHHPQFNTVVFRRGIEIAAREGDPVHAVSDGQIAYADWYKGYGKLVIIEHGPGFYTLYGNLSRLDLKKGDRVARGQVIGLAGETGSLKGPKLYFEMRRDGEAQDPLLWLSKK